MMRTLFILLVLANLLFLAWAEGYFGAPDEGREPQRLTRQLAPEKLKIVRATLPGGKAQADACRLIDGLSAEDIGRLRSEALAKLPGLQLTGESTEDLSSYWVLIPPLPDRAAAEKKLAELKRLGLSGYQLVEEEGPLKWAIMLGAFAEQKAGNDFVQGLAKRGVRSAKLQAREKAVLKVRLQGSAESLDEKLRELLHAYPAAVATSCAERP